MLKPSKRIAAFVLMLSLLFSSLGLNVTPAAAASVKATCTQWYTVRVNDTIAKIARRHKVTQRYILRLNKISESDLQVGDRICVSDEGSSTSTTGGATSWSGAKVWTTTVYEDESAVVKGSGMPAATQVSVFMYRTGASSSSGYKAGTVKTSASGAFSTTFNLPKKLVDVEKVTVQVRSGSLVLAENWFWNEDGGGQGAATGDDGMTLKISSVDQGNDVTVKASGFPKQTRFTVSMAAKKGSNRDWIKVGSVSTGSKTTFTATYDIPEEIDDAGQIILRFESADGKSEVSIVFTNSDSNSSGGKSNNSDISLEVIDVVQDIQVRVKFNDLPVGEKFTVYIGTASSKGTDGNRVGVVTANADQSFSKAFSIPDSFKTVKKLAVRIVSSENEVYTTFIND